MTLAGFNAAPADEAVATMLTCCGSRRFAQAMAAGAVSVGRRRGDRR